MAKRILIVGSSLQDKGGIVTVMKNIDSLIDKKSFEINYIPTYLSSTNLLIRLFMYFKALISIISFILFRKVDLIHIHMSYKGSFYRKSIIILIGKIFKKPVFVHIHGSKFKDFYNNSNIYLRKYINFILNKADKVIVLSKEWANFFNKIINERNNLIILYNAVKIPSIKKEYNTKSESANFIFLGRLGERKGIFDLLEAIRIVKNKTDNQSKFYLAGDGELDKVKNYIKKYKLKDDIFLLGWVSPDERRNLLLENHALILPSYNEGLPMAILEAMSYGKAIISTPVGGIPEVVKDGENGLLVKPGDIESLANAILLIDRMKDFREEMYKANIRKIKNNFDLNHQVRQLEDLYFEQIKD